ncbi:MAG: hypothetical protein JWN15_2970, partial [Firmicutes bacterium]|nr:hypothetical protein [Bacillota bacterium]
MLFHMPEFMVLLILTLLCFWPTRRLRIPVLAVAALLFYSVSGWQYLLLFLGMMTLTHLLAAYARGPYGRVAVWVGVLANLANLVLFKYTGLMVSSVNRLLHLGLNEHVWQLLLPIGISFYTFQLIAYLVDVYKGRTEPARNLLEMWVFIAFYGHLIAGPIMRGGEFLEQVHAAPKQRLDWQRFQYGIYLFGLGMVKKVMFSDVLGPKVDALFAQATTLGGLEAWVAGWLFAFQIYFDFSAYSEMALGIGHLFGFELAVNFRTPYLSQNPQEFWTRWHITLSSWIRDYLYIPLGGSRRGEGRAYLNLVLAMALSGLWHGAAWTFVIWGIFHGLLSALHKFWGRRVLKPLGIEPRGAWVRWLSIFLMFQATTIGWIFFRAHTFSGAVALVRKMLNPTLWHVTPLVAGTLP